MAHGTQDAKGALSYPNEINWRTDATRVGDGGGATTPLQSVWAAWRFTGDDKYLRPIEARLARGGGGALAEFNENGFDALTGGDAVRRALAASKNSDPFALYARWSASGDTGALTALHEAAIREKAARRYMYTEGHWWSDRVDQPTDILQRERLGGIALRRNQIWPGHTVSWRFDDPAAAEQVAILLPDATRERFRVLAYNTTGQVRTATMTAWNVSAGRWTM